MTEENTAPEAVQEETPAVEEEEVATSEEETEE